MDQYIRSLALLLCFEGRLFYLVRDPLSVCGSYLVLPFVDSLVTEVFVGIFLYIVLFWITFFELWFQLISIMSTSSFSKEDFAKWNQTTSVFYLPKRLVGKGKVTSLRSELVKTIGESKVSAVQALPGLKFRVCFVSSSFRQYYDINGLNFRGLTITPFPAYEEVKAVFVDRAPPQMPDKYLYDCLAPYGRVISVKHLTIKGFLSVHKGYSS